MSPMTARRVLVAMIGIPWIARRFFQALRPDGAGSNGGA